MKTAEMIAELLTELTPEEVKQMVDKEIKKKEAVQEKKNMELDGARAKVVIAIVRYLETLGLFEVGAMTQEKFEQFKETLIEIEAELLPIMQLNDQLGKATNRDKCQCKKRSATDALEDFLRSIS